MLADGSVLTNVSDVDWTIATATNNQQILDSCLLRSPDLPPADRVLIQRGYSSAAAAYNDAIDRAQTDIVVLTHQDVFLPVGWVADVEKALQSLAQRDPNWAVLGAWGVAADGKRSGHLYCTGSAVALGRQGLEPLAVRSLDEVLLIVRKSSGVRFDPTLPGFHMYGTDICLEAERLGFKSYAISAFFVHNTNGYAILPWAFWKSCLDIRRKWWDRLPVITPCATITRWCWPMIRHNLATLPRYWLGQRDANVRVADPAELHAKISREQSPAAAGGAGN